MKNRIIKAGCGHYEYTHRVVMQLAITRCRVCADKINRLLGRRVRKATQTKRDTN